MNKLIEQAYTLGYKYEKEFRGCAQCTVAAVQDTLNIRNDLVFKSACGLGAGCGLLCDGICGGYSGGIILMSMLFGRRRDYFDDDEFEKRCAFRMAVSLHEKFIEKYNTVICKDIHKRIFGRTYNLLNPEEKEQFNNDGAHESKCTDVVGTAASWVTGLIIKELKDRALPLSALQELI